MILVGGRAIVLEKKTFTENIYRYERDENPRCAFSLAIIQSKWRDNMSIFLFSFYALR